MVKKDQLFVLGSEIVTSFLAILFLLIGFKFFSFDVPVSNDFILSLQLFLKWLILPTLTIVLGIYLIMYQRMTTKAINPLLNLRDNRYLKIFKQYLQNTLEQSILFLFAQLGFIVVVPFNYLTLVPLFAILFFIGRITFLLGYLYNPLLRAPGYGLTFYPTLFTIFYVLFKLFF